MFSRARAAGLHSVPHAGETTGPQTIWDALEDLGAERIGHGTSAVQDPALVEHLVETQIPLEVCPTSNIATRAVDRLENHPIKQLYDAGVHVTVNSDDPPMFGTTLTREYEIAARPPRPRRAPGWPTLATNAVTRVVPARPEKAALAGEISELPDRLGREPPLRDDQQLAGGPAALEVLVGPAGLRERVAPADPDVQGAVGDLAEHGRGPGERAPRGRRRSGPASAG